MMVRERWISQDRGLPVLVAVGIGLGDQLVSTSGWRLMRSNAQPSVARGGFVTGGQQRQQFVADVLARHRRTVLVGAAQQQRENVVPVFEVRVGLYRVDEPTDHLVVLRAGTRRGAPTG